MPRASVRRKILVAVADPILRAVMADVFTSHGLAVVSAADGGDVIGVAEDEDPDVVLVEENLPGLDGIDIAQSIRRHPLLAHLPVMMLASGDTPRDANTILPAGVDDVVALKDADLVRRVLDCMRRSRYRQLRTMQSAVNWIVEHCDTGFLWIDEKGHWLGENDAARRLLNLQPHTHSPETLVQHLANYFSLETKALWRTWPRPTPQNTPRLLVSRPDGRPVIVLEVSVVPAKFGPLRLVKIDDATGAYRQTTLASGAGSARPYSGPLLAQH